MRSERYSRRALLKTMGIGAGFLPLLNAERSPAAAASGFPIRFISIVWTNGAVPPNFYPATSVVAGPLPATLPPVLTPLTTWSSKILSMRAAKTQTSPINLSCMSAVSQPGTFGGHSAYPALLTGYNPTGGKPAGPSLDTAIATNLATQGVTNAQLNISVRSGSSSTSWTATGGKNTGQTDPYKLFTSLFAGAGMPVAQVNALLLRRQSVLDFVAAKLTSFASNLGTDDKITVQNHLDSIRSLESNLQASTALPATCTPPTLTPAGITFGTNNAEFPTLVTFMADLAAAAVICGKSRAVTMDIMDDGGGNSLDFPWLNIPSPDFHAIAHKGSADFTDKTAIDTWFYTAAVAEVVSRLAAVPEGSGTVLDNTVVLVSSDMNQGDNHDVNMIPYLIIGSGGGFFKTGQLVTFPSQMPNNQLLTSIAHAMGMTTLTGFGDPTYTGDLDSYLKA